MLRLANIAALCVLAFIALGTVAFGVLAVRAFVVPVRLYSPDELVVVSGRVERVDTESGGQFWVEGQRLPFRGVLRQEAFDQIHEGEPVRVGFLRSEQDSPRRVYLSGQEFRELCSLEISGRTVQSLDDFNRYIERESIGGRFAWPIMFLTGIGACACLLVCRSRLRSGSLSELFNRNRRPRIRDSLPAGAVLGVYASLLLGIHGWYGEGWAGQWAGPGAGGALLGVAVAFAFGIGVAIVLGAIPVLCFHANRWAGKSKRRTIPLAAITLILTGWWFVATWDDNRIGRIVAVLVLVSAGVAVLVRRAVVAGQATALAGTGDEGHEPDGSPPS